MRDALLLMALAGVAACSQPADPRGVRRGEVLLQVAATGRSEVKPDEARFTVGVTTNAATAGAASTGNAAAANRVVAALAKLGVAEDDVQTRSVTLSRIDYGPERGRFRADNLVEVRVRDIRPAGAAVGAATEAGGNVVSGPDLRVSRPEAADDAAYAAAYKAARARAEAYAGAAGLKVARVLAIRDGGVEAAPIGYGYGGAVTEATAVAPPPIAARSPPVRAGVDVREVRVRADFVLK
jgi:uncharacterized protein YggE